MNVLILYAHPEPTSFTGALKDVAVRTLEAAGHVVEVSDLYAERFDPVAGRHDFRTVADPARFHYQSEQSLAHRIGGFAPDIAREQQRFLKADLLIMQYPLWWGGMPAILKGWFDRVLAMGFAYADGQRYDTGFFRGRRGLICITTGGTRQRFSTTGVYGDIQQVLWPVQRLMVEYLGLEALEPFVAYAAPRVEQAERAAYLRVWETRLLALAGAGATRPAETKVA